MPDVKFSPQEGFPIIIKNGSHSVRTKAILDTGANSNTIPEDIARYLGLSEYDRCGPLNQRKYHCTLISPEDESRLGTEHLIAFDITQSDRVTLTLVTNI